MRMRVKPQSAFCRQPGTGEKPVTAFDPPELSPSVLTMGIPYFIPRIGTPSPMAPSRRSFVSPPNAQKQASFPREVSTLWDALDSHSDQFGPHHPRLSWSPVSSRSLYGRLATWVERYSCLRRAIDCIASSFGREDPMRSVRAG
jgi:hypothetical protein